ncbi:MAG: hypothetical protein Q7I94_00730 [Candidatus Contubernalis sp.]|nr:hypothetical protein [Candidatus Contubernalis sp.]
MKELTEKEILYIHYTLAKRKGKAPGVRDISLLKAAVLRPKSKFQGQELYPDVYAKAAALTQFILKSRPFNSLNTSAGIAIGAPYLKKNNISLKAPEEELLRLGERAGKGNLEVKELITWFRHYSEER